MHMTPLYTHDCNYTFYLHASLTHGPLLVTDTATGREVAGGKGHYIQTWIHLSNVNCACDLLNSPHACEWLSIAACSYISILSYSTSYIIIHYVITVIAIEIKTCGTSELHSQCLLQHCQFVMSLLKVKGPGVLMARHVPDPVVLLIANSY